METRNEQSGRLHTVRIAPRAQQIMAPSSPARDAAPLIAPRLAPDAAHLASVVDDAAQRPHVRQVAPQAVALAHVAALQLPRASCPEALPRIGRVEDVEVALEA